jgi:ribosomal protein S6
VKIFKIAVTEDQNRKKIDAQEESIKDLKAKLKKTESEIKKLTKQIDDLNIGDRRFFQQKSIFTSLQRKIERFEKLETEWNKFKNTVEDDIKSEIEKRTRAQVVGKSPLA